MGISVCATEVALDERLKRPLQPVQDHQQPLLPLFSPPPFPLLHTFPPLELLQDHAQPLAILSSTATECSCLLDSLAEACKRASTDGLRMQQQVWGVGRSRRVSGGQSLKSLSCVHFGHSYLCSLSLVFPLYHTLGGQV